MSGKTVGANTGLSFKGRCAGNLTVLRRCHTCLRVYTDVLAKT